jgi:hypothetical protein
VKAVGLAIPDPAATASQPKLDGINGHMWAYRVCSAPRNGRLPLFGPRRDHVGRETKGPLAQTSEVKRITIDCNDETAQRPATHHPSRKRNGSMILNPTLMGRESPHALSRPRRTPHLTRSRCRELQSSLYPGHPLQPNWRR